MIRPRAMAVSLVSAAVAVTGTAGSVVAVSFGVHIHQWALWAFAGAGVTAAVVVAVWSVRVWRWRLLPQLARDPVLAREIEAIRTYGAELGDGLTVPYHIVWLGADGDQVRVGVEGVPARCVPARVTTLHLLERGDGPQNPRWVQLDLDATLHAQLVGLLMAAAGVHDERHHAGSPGR